MIVYFVRSGDDGPVKIGFARNSVTERIRALQIVVRRRRTGKEQCDEEDALVDLYEHAIEEGSRPSRARARESEDQTEIAFAQ